MGEKRYTRFFETNLDLELKTNTKMATVYWGPGQNKKLGVINLDPNLFDQGSVKSGKNEAASQAILAAVENIPEIKKFVPTGKFVINHAENFSVISDKLEFSIEFDKKNQVGVLTALK